jgi:type I restriction-modification system DNA methylase subunit
MKKCYYNKNEFDNENNIRDLNMLKTIDEKNNYISNKEALKNMIHDIHNYLRNNGAGYGMNALKTFSILYGLKKIEEKGLLDKVNLSDECKFSYLLQLANENNDEKLAELIYSNVLDSINNSKIKDILFYEIPNKHIKGSVFSYLIKEIDKITIIEKTCNVLLSGKIYEYFIGRDESAISELGAYFTNRYIVDYILKKINPSINVGEKLTVIDPFGGSGGFTTGYINFINEKYPNFNWENEIDNIYHYDMNEDVVKSAGLEIFSLTGELPNTKSNLTYKNSFTDEFENKKFKIQITNPPYGGDKDKKDDKKTKLKEYIKKELPTITDEETKIRRQKQLKNIENQEKQNIKESNKVCLGSCSARIQKFAKDNNLSGNDKESCSLMLLMDLLEIGGTTIGVLKEGVFFDKKYKDLRKCLVEKFNVREIISVPQNQFENTSTKTSIVIFDNTLEKTSSVIFYDLIVETYTEDKFEEIFGEIVITESKGDISYIRDTLISEATKEEILNNNIYSLNGKVYNKKEIVVGDGYELVKLGDICEFLPKSKRNASFGKPIGKYNFYTSSDKVQRCDSADYLEECLIIGSGGVSNIKIDNIFSCSADNIILKAPNNRYLYNLIKGNMNLLSDGFTGSTLKHLSKDYLTNLKIPIPKSKHKITEWVDKISKPYDKKNKNQELINKLEEDIKNKIKEIEKNEECDEVELGSICDINPESIKKKQFSYINYIDIGSVKEGKINNIQLLTANFPSRAKRIINKNDILFSTVRPNLKGYTFISEEIKNGIATSGFVVIRSNKIHPKYIYLILTDDSIVDFLMTHSTGTNYPAVNSNVFEKIKIKIPKNKTLINNFEPLFNEIEKLQIELKEAELEYTQLIKELSEEAIPTNKIHIEKIISKNTEDVEEINEILSNNEDIEKNKNNDDKQINLEKKSKKELEKICKDKCIIFKSKDKKQILIEKIINHKDD